MGSTNVDAIRAALMDLVHCCDLDQPGPGGSSTLADAIFDVDVQGIRRRSLDGQHGPAGEPWANNEATYAARKGGRPIGVLTGRMLSEEELAGIRAISSDRALMRYGVTGWAIQKAEWFEDGTERQPERPFYDSSEDDTPTKEALVNRQIEDTIQRLG